jgi:hypothetical protein
VTHLTAGSFSTNPSTPYHCHAGPDVTSHRRHPVFSPALPLWLTHGAPKHHRAAHGRCRDAPQPSFRIPTVHVPPLHTSPYKMATAVPPGTPNPSRRGVFPFATREERKGDPEAVRQLAVTAMKTGGRPRSSRTSRSHEHRRRLLTLLPLPNAAHLPHCRRPHSDFLHRCLHFDLRSPR